MAKGPAHPTVGQILTMTLFGTPKRFWTTVAVVAGLLVFCTMFPALIQLWFEDLAPLIVAIIVAIIGLKIIVGVAKKK